MSKQNSVTRLDPLSFPLHGSRLIEASAGTGKTYTLAALYVRLVLQHGGENAFARSLLPPEILVVTFTEAATRELRDRIRERLAGAARCFRGDETPDSGDLFLQNLLADYPSEQHQGCADLLDAAAQWMDEAAVYTIHSFSNRMLKQHAFDSGSLFNLELSQQEHLLQEEAARDYWRTFCYPLDVARARALAEHYATPDALLKAVRPLLGAEQLRGEDTDTPPEKKISEVSQQRSQRLKQIKAYWKEQISSLLSEFERAWQDERLSRKKPSAEKKMREWLGQVADWANDPERIAFKLTDTAKKNLTAQGIAPHGENIDSLLSHPALNELPSLLSVAAEMPDLGVELLPHAGEWIDRRIRRYKDSQAIIGFDDMLTRLRTALLDKQQGERLARIIREQYPVALIDEFQDTDPVQYDTFHRIYADQQDTGWFMIGDPKQAIYGFRGADIYTYLKARHFTAGRHYTLGTNFRSAKPMVEAVNHLFDRPDQLPDGAFLLKDEIPFLPVQASDKREQFQVQGKVSAGLTFWQLPSSNADDNSMAKGEYLRRMASGCAAEIVRLLNLGSQNKAGISKDDDFKPLRPADIAILVRTGAEADEIRHALQRHGVRSVYLSDKDNVLASPEAGDTLRWLKACAEPENENLLRAALGTPTLAQSWQALETLCSDENLWEQTVEQFRDYQRTWQRRGVLPMLRRLMGDFHIAERLLTEGDERALTNLLHLAELLQTAATGQDGEQALLRWFSDAVAEAGDGSEEQVLRLESDADLIKVVTIHKSKGLEYPLVFLPFVCSFREVKDSDRPVRYHDPDGNLKLSLTPDEDIRQAADHERLAEDLRLLYVAVTRARHRCWVGLAPMRVGRSKHVTHLHQSAIGYLLAGGEIIKPDDLEKLLTPLADNDGIDVVGGPFASEEQLIEIESNEMETRAPVYQGPRPERWWIASYSALRPGAVEQDDGGPASNRDNVIDDEEPTPAKARFIPGTDAGVHGFVRGPLPGTFLHGLLEQAADVGFAKSLQPGKDSLAELVSSRTRVRGWQHWAPLLTNWLSDFLKTALPFGDSEIRLDQLQSGQYRPELEFMLEASQVSSLALDQIVSTHVLPDQPRPKLGKEQLHGMLKGFIDLVFEHQGRYYLADYKSNWLGNRDAAYHQSSMQQTVLDKRQDVQLSLYTLALHRLLRARLGDSYDIDQHLGGSALLFLRGLYSDSRGVWFQPPNRALIEALDDLFANREQACA